MASILDIDQTIKEGVKDLNEKIFWKLHVVCPSFYGASLIYGKNYPYFRIDSIRAGITLFRLFLDQTTMNQFKWEWEDKQWIIPDWVEFKVKGSAYQKKHGYKPFVELKHDRVQEILFSNGTKTKEFDNCIVIIKKVHNVWSI